MHGFEAVENQFAPGLAAICLGAAYGDEPGQAGHCDIAPALLRQAAYRTNEPGEEPFYIWSIEHGELRVEQHDGTTLRFGEGSLLLHDASQPLDGCWSQARLGFVRLSRWRAAELLGHAPAAQGHGIMRLDRFGLAPFLGSQLRLLGGQGASMTRAELREALAMLLHNAEVLLTLALSTRLASDATPADDRLRAVQRYIQKNLHRHDLSVEQIAIGINSSRAQLYRLFETQTVSVHGSVREARLQRSFEYLQRWESERLSIGAIAYACGFSDQSVFSKLFRQRFGMTPSEAREAHSQAAACGA